MRLEKWPVFATFAGYTMCTLIVLHRCLAGKPLVVAANRDEFLARPAEGPAIRAGRTGAVLSPLDLEAGGTWLGLNGHGVFVGLTNLRPQTSDGEPEVAPPKTAEEAARLLRDAENIPVVAGARSRGEVVTAALEARTAREAAAQIEALEADAYNPFQLVIADGNEASLTVYRRRPVVKPLTPGVYVVGNVVEDEDAVVLGPAEQPRARKLVRIRERVEKLTNQPMAPGQDLLESLAEVCREHVEVGENGFQPSWLSETQTKSSAKSGNESAEPASAISPFESTCVHVEDRYGTRSAFLLELADDPNSSRLWTADGPPCEQPFVDMSGLLLELDRRSRAEQVH